MKFKKKPKFLKANIKEIKNKDYKKRLLLSLSVIFLTKCVNPISQIMDIWTHHRSMVRLMSLFLLSVSKSVILLQSNTGNEIKFNPNEIHFLLISIVMDRNK